MPPPGTVPARPLPLPIGSIISRSRTPRSPLWTYACDNLALDVKFPQRAHSNGSSSDAFVHHSSPTGFDADGVPGPVGPAQSSNIPARSVHHSPTSVFRLNSIRRQSVPLNLTHESSGWMVGGAPTNYHSTFWISIIIGYPLRCTMFRVRCPFCCMTSRIL